MLVKIWLDDIREAPNGYIHVRSVNNAKLIINQFIERGYEMELDLDHDLGDYACDGGDAICLVRWLAENEIYPTIVDIPWAEKSKIDNIMKHSENIINFKG